MSACLYCHEIINRSVTGEMKEAAMHTQCWHNVDQDNKNHPFDWTSDRSRFDTGCDNCNTDTCRLGKGAHSLYFGNYCYRLNGPSLSGAIDNSKCRCCPTLESIGNERVEGDDNSKNQVQK